MPLPIQDTINVNLTALQKLVGNTDGLIQKNFGEEGCDSIESLEAALTYLGFLSNKMNEELAGIIDKVQKELEKEKKRKVRL